MSEMRHLSFSACYLVTEFDCQLEDAIDSPILEFSQK